MCVQHKTEEGKKQKLSSTISKARLQNEHISRVYVKVLSCKHKTWNPREELQIRVETFEKDADVMKGEHESTGIGKPI